MHNQVKKILIICISAFTLMVATPTLPDASAQCPMCRMSVESNLKAGGTAGRGLNRGILYMLAMPYLLVGTIGYVWWRNRRREEELELIGEIGNRPSS